ncbi:carbohydrate kinase family protein [Candidatus Izemoplasma sp. B36]|uniref:carbohydrate kinase family protein n=1 Tax=Candidatus Izemoplasma sp. B36 TaxID=3242468 RepID=UPI003558C778
MGYDLITSGYCALDRIISVDSFVEVGRTSIITNKNHNQIYYGGCNVNVSVNLARLGLNAAPIIRVGNDYITSGFKEYLEKNNVNTTAVKLLDKQITSATYLIESPDHEHITLFYPGAMDNSLQTPYKDEWFIDSKCALMTVASLNDNKEFLNKVKKHNLPLFLGMKMDSDAFPKSFLKECLDHVEVLFTNKSEAKCIAEIYDLEDYKELINVLPKVKTIVITLGEKGSCALYKKDNEIKYVEVPIINIEKVVDTVGSGDAFIAGYIYGYLNNKTIKESMEYGATLASFVIQGLGSTTNSPNKEELIERYLNHYKRR